MPALKIEVAEPDGCCYNLDKTETKCRNPCSAHECYLPGTYMKIFSNIETQNNFHKRITNQIKGCFFKDHGTATKFADYFCLQISGAKNADYLAQSAGYRMLGWVRDGELWLTGEVGEKVHFQASAGAVPVR